MSFSQFQSVPASQQGSSQSSRAVSHDRKAAQAYSAEQWESQRERFSRLYSVERRPLREVVRLMEQLHGFQATERQYKRKINEWRLNKNIKRHEMEAALEGYDVPDDNYGALAALQVHGRLVEKKKLKRYLRTRSASVDAPRDPIGQNPAISSSSPTGESFGHGQQVRSNAELLRVQQAPVSDLELSVHSSIHPASSSPLPNSRSTSPHLGNRSSDKPTNLHRHLELMMIEDAYVDANGKKRKNYQSIIRQPSNPPTEGDWLALTTAQVLYNVWHGVPHSLILSSDIDAAKPLPPGLLQILDNVRLLLYSLGGLVETVVRLATIIICWLYETDPSPIAIAKPHRTLVGALVLAELSITSHRSFSLVLNNVHGHSISFWSDTCCVPLQDLRNLTRQFEATVDLHRRMNNLEDWKPQLLKLHDFQNQIMEGCQRSWPKCSYPELKHELRQKSHMAHVEGPEVWGDEPNSLVDNVPHILPTGPNTEALWSLMGDDTQSSIPQLYRNATTTALSGRLRNTPEPAFSNLSSGSLERFGPLAYLDTYAFSLPISSVREQTREEDGQSAFSSDSWKYSLPSIARLRMPSSRTPNSGEIPKRT